MYLVYLKYWTLNLMPIMVYPKVLVHPMYSIKAQTSRFKISRSTAAAMTRSIPTFPACHVMKLLAWTLRTGHQKLAG